MRVDGRLPLVLLQHQVGEHHRARLAAWLDAHERGAQRLRLVELARDEVQPREGEGALLVRVVVLERLLVRRARLARVRVGVKAEVRVGVSFQVRTGLG